MKKIGIALVIIGIVITVFSGISFKHEESLLEVGDYEVTQEKEKEVTWPRWLGLAVVVAGGAIFVFARKK
jgi:uncharacterized membrane protein YdcZ (DUF606 family)